MKKLALALLFIPSLAIAQQSPFITDDRQHQAVLESRARTRTLNEISKSLEQERAAQLAEPFVRALRAQQAPAGSYPSTNTYESIIGATRDAAIMQILQDNAAGRKTRW